MYPAVRVKYKSKTNVRMPKINWMIRIRFKKCFGYSNEDPCTDAGNSKCFGWISVNYWAFPW